MAVALWLWRPLAMAGNNHLIPSGLLEKLSQNLFVEKFHLEMHNLRLENSG